LRYPTSQIFAAVIATAGLFTVPAAAQEYFVPGAYVGVEIGGTYHQNIVFSDTNPLAVNCDLCAAQFPSTTQNSWFGGARLGYRLTPNFRTDFTLDYFAPVTLTGQSTTTPPSTGSAKLTSYVGLYNVYADLWSPAFGLIQPYLSAGIGFARNSIGVTNGNSPLGPFSISSNSQTNFAWALGAGFSFPLSPWLTADAGYRFMQLGEVRTGSIVTIGGQALQLTASKTDPLYVHAITVGLRYSLW
jgi:opacity protein-like surface antigen